MNKSSLGAGKEAGGGGDCSCNATSKHERATTTARFDNSDSARVINTKTACIVTKLQPNDVLMGRGSNVMLHQGNKRFIDIVRSRCVEYQSISSRKQKHIIAQQIVSTVRSQKGLFLRKIESSASSAEEAQKTGVVPASSSAETMWMWTLVDENAILLKVKQALRDQSLVMNTNSVDKVGSQHQHSNTPNKGSKKKRTKVVAKKLSTDNYNEGKQGTTIQTKKI